MPKKKRSTRLWHMRREVAKTFGRIVGYCVYTSPSGQTPAKKVKCFKAKKAAKTWARRGNYQVIPQRKK